MVFRSPYWDSGVLGRWNSEMGTDSQEGFDPTTRGAPFSSEHFLRCSAPERSASTDTCSIPRTFSGSTHASLTAPGSASLSSVFSSPWLAYSSSNWSANRDSNNHGCTYSGDPNSSTINSGAVNSSTNSSSASCSSTSCSSASCSKASCSNASCSSTSCSSTSCSSTSCSSTSCRNATCKSTSCSNVICSSTSCSNARCSSGKESKGSVAVKKLAFFCLGVSCGLPWNCVVVEMTEFQHFYLPTFPWVSTATAVRTCCLLLGHLLLCFLSLHHSAVWMSAGGSALSALCCLLLSLVAPSAVRTAGGGELQGPLGAPTSPTSEGHAFAVSCILLGISSFCCCGIRSGLYIQQALTHKSIVSSWVLGMAIGGPLTALAALGLHWCMYAAPPQQKTQLLMGASGIWLLLSAVLFACALATSKPSEKQTPKQQRKLRLQQQPVTALPHADFPALEAAASAAAPTADTTAAYQRERPEQQQPPEAGMDEGSQDTNCSWPANETTALLHDFVRHNRSNSSSSSKGKYLECVTEGLKVQSGVFQQFEVYAFVFRCYRQSLLCTFFLSFSTFIIYPVKLQCMLPCSSTDPALFQLLLIVIYHLGVVAGRCCSCCCCFSSSSQRLIPPVLVLRLALLPLLFWLEAAPAKLLPVLRAATAAIAAAGGTGLRGASTVARPESLLGHEQSAATAALPGGVHKQHVELLLLLVDAGRCLWLFVFATVHGCLSLTGTLYTTRTPETYAHKAAVARLLCLFESTGLALGTLLSLSLAPPLQPLYGWQQAAVTALTHLA